MEGRVEGTGQRLQLPGQVDKLYEPRALELDERDAVSLWRESRVVDLMPRLVCLVEHFPDGVLQAIVAADCANDRQASAVGSVVGPLHPVQKRSRLAADEGNFG